MVNINFNPTEYTHTEGDSPSFVTLMVELSSSSDREVTVDVVTSDGTAIGQSEAFLGSISWS